MNAWKKKKKEEFVLIYGDKKKFKKRKEKKMTEKKEESKVDLTRASTIALSIITMVEKEEDLDNEGKLMALQMALFPYLQIKTIKQQALLHPTDFLSALKNKH